MKGRGGGLVVSILAYCSAESRWLLIFLVIVRKHKNK